MSDYEGREQSKVKHFILRKYLQRFAYIIGSFKDVITYVDCFSGPWNVQSPDLSDSSFAIAVEELAKARDELRTKRGRNVGIRCFFLEKDKAAFQQLDAFARRVSAAGTAEVVAKNLRLDQAIPDILHFVNAGGARAFPFIFIDPKGWTGFEYEVIRPLLALQPCEVLVNFMTSFVRRFITSPDQATTESFKRTFGPYLPPAGPLASLIGEDLDDALVAAYKALVRDAGQYRYVCDAIVLHPDVDSTHYRLIYGTRNPKGVEVFKAAERGAMEIQKQDRARLRGKKLEERDGTPGLFSPEVLGETRHQERLAGRYRAIARRRIVSTLMSRESHNYDDLCLDALSLPLVQEADVKQWFDEWGKKGLVQILGMKARQRVPRLGGKLRVTRIGQVS